MCFNAAKSWQLGWYDDKSKDVMPQNGAFTGDLSAFVDYKNIANGGYVIFKVGTKYLIFNKAKGINQETQEFANQVTITDMPNEGDYSYAVASLSGTGQKYNFAYNGGNAVIEMCSTSNNGGVDAAKISIYMNTDNSSCGNAPTVTGPSPTGPPPTSALLPTGSASAQSRPNPTAPPVPALTSMSVPVPTPMLVAPPTPPPTFATCAVDQMEVAITIHTDQKPEETTWYFKRQRGETYGSEGPYHERAHTYVYKYCVKSSDTFEFHLNDSGNDGISSNAFGHGWYTISIDGETYSTGGTFTTEEIDYVHGPCSTEGTERLQFILLTGTKPQDVTWNLKAEGVIDYTGLSLNYFSHSCLSAEQCYTITVMLANNNGLDSGNFEINWMGENVAFSTFSNGAAEAFSFGNCEGTTDARKLDLIDMVLPEVYESIGA